jgi:PAS domain S-box-containing protein
MSAGSAGGDKRPLLDRLLVHFLLIANMSKCRHIETSTKTPPLSNMARMEFPLYVKTAGCEPSRYSSVAIMQDEKKTKSQLIAELKEARRQIAAAKGSSSENTAEEHKTKEGLSQVDDQCCSMINSMAAAINVVDTDMRVVLVNKAFQKWNQKLGLTTDVIGKLLFEVFPFLPEKVWKEYQQVLETGQTLVTVEETSIDGQIYTTETRKIPVMQDGSVVRIVTVISDITEQKRAEDSLRESEEKFRELVNSLPQVIFEADTEGNLTFANRNAFQLFGYAPEDVKKSLNVLQTIVSEDRERARENMAAIMKGKTGKDGNEYRALRKDGTVFPVVVHSTPIIVKGKPTGLRGIIVDISDRVQAEERFRLAAQVTADLIYEWDVKTDALRWFGNFDEALGYEPGEIPRTLEAWIQLIHPEDLDRMKDSVERHRTSTEAIREEYRVRRKDGHWLYWMDRGTPVLDEYQRPIKWIGGCTDITERKHSEAIQAVLYRISNAVHTTQDLNELFNEIRRELSTVLNTDNFFIALYDKDGDTFSLPYFKDERDEFQKYPAGKTLTAYVVRHDKALLVTNEDIKKLEVTGEVDRVGSPSKIWLGVPLKVGQEIIGALVVQSYTDEHAYDETDRELLQFVSNQIGISIERKRAEEALKASDERYRIITNQTGQLIYDYDIRTGCIEWAGAIGAVTGFTLKEFQKVDNDRWKSMIHPEDRERTLNYFDEAQRTTKKYQMEYRFQTKNGGYINILDEGVFLSNEDGRIVRLLGTMKDVTDCKRAEQALQESEEQLRQSQKMEAVGRLAGGIAHDLNNLLTGVTGYGDLLANKIPESSSLRKYVVEIQHAAQRAAALIGQLLAFSRKQILQPKVISLNETVGRMEDMLQRVISEDVELITFLSPNLGSVRADPGQIEQVIMNLAVNARDAMPRGGKLTIETANVTLDETYAKKHPEAQPGSYVMLSVSDTGEGMDKETQRRIYEPFFTTKEVGKGTGLGLSTIYGIVKQSGGTIWLYSEPRHGTIFKIYLPRIDREESLSCPISSEGKSEEKIAQPTETILVVEDEDIVRKLAEEILQKCGYTVLSAADGKEALSLCEEHTGSIDLLLTDIIMPGMNGCQLAKRLSHQWPEIRVLYISGYTDDLVVRHGELDPGTEFLQKPFTSKILTTKIRRILDLRNQALSPRRRQSN